MSQESRRRRAIRAGIALGAVLAIGFAADAVLVLTTRARADAANAVATPARDRPFAFGDGLARKVRAGGSDGWTVTMMGTTVALVVFGAMVAASRKFLPQSQAAGMQVIGRASLSPKHAVYMLRIAERVLVVGVGPQGAPALITELDDTTALQPAVRGGEDS